MDRWADDKMSKWTNEQMEEQDNSMNCNTAPFILFLDSSRNRGKWVRCHHYMKRHRVADGGDGLQVFRVAADSQ